MHPITILSLTLCATLAAGCQGLHSHSPKGPDLAILESGQTTNLIGAGSTLAWAPLKTDAYETAGPTKVTDTQITLHAGKPYAGVRWTGTAPTDNYELSLEATRTKGNDIFCGIFFPVGTNHCSLILGGWGNSLVGLSMVDDLSAAENETAYPETFTNSVWTKVVLRVTPKLILAEVDGKQAIELEREFHRVSPYLGLEFFEPLGLFTYESDAIIRNVHLRKLPEE